MFEVRPATKDDIPLIKYIADRNKDTLGFILSPSLAESIESNSLFVAVDLADDCVVGFVNAYPRRRDNYVTIMEIGVETEYRGRGIGRKLIGKIQHSFLGRPIRLKCVEGAKANGFYQHLGFKLLDYQPAKDGKRALNVWHLT